MSWYWHRLRAMSPLEVLLHVRKKWREAKDAQRTFDVSGVRLESSPFYPRLPPAENAPEPVREALRADATALLAGHWRMFGHLDLKVDDPPAWQRDYLVGRNLGSQEPAFGLNHRALPEGADIRVVWELNRWHQLTRLAMAAYVLGEEQPARKCLTWLQNWLEVNPPYRGWNWTSGLEVGLRLVQFAWIDALLSSSRLAAQVGPTLETLRARVLPAHLWYAWRHRSFGSSANNHLLGELAGLILATVRWPAAARWAAPLACLQELWEGEVLKQFAEDGGNREQTLGYQLFAWELCWQSRTALEQAGAVLPRQVEERLVQALRFFWEVQARDEQWDYGDSDDGSTTPFMLNDKRRVREWHEWAADRGQSPGLDYWIGQAPTVGSPRLGSGTPTGVRRLSGWWIYQDSGLALNQSGYWGLRWDLSPLGYLRTAAHGHLDVLHLSIWYHRVALVIDPGTGAYFADAQLRAWLASRQAHNGPADVNFAKIRRLGPFLWSGRHGGAQWKQVEGLSLEAQCLGYSRRVTQLVNPDGWQVEDRPCGFRTRSRPFTVRWQFAPGAWVKRISDRKYSVHRADVSVMVEADTSWQTVELIELSEAQEGAPVGPSGLGSFDGAVSPAFRQVLLAPCLKLTAQPKPSQPCVFRTTFLACPAA